MVRAKGSSRIHSTVERLLFSSMITARTCERFKLLSQELKDEELSTFYHDFMISEAEHYITFIGFARKYGKYIDIN